MTTTEQWHPGVVGTQPHSVTGLQAVDRNLKAVMLADGLWYAVEDPTLPQGPDGYLSFLQRGRDGSAVMVNVAMSDVKAASYYGMPISGFHV